MKGIKYIIIILLILLVLVITTMLIISKNNRGSNIKNNDNVISNELKQELNEPDYTDERVTADKITVLNNTNTFFSIEKMITRYFLYLRAGNSNAIYTMLENSYKVNNSINEQNVLTELRKGIPYDGVYGLKEVYVKADNYKPIYFIFGEIEKNNTRVPYYLVMKQDLYNASFSLKPITKEQYELYKKQKITEKFEEAIKLGEYNNITNITLTNEELAKKYFNAYIHNARYFPQEAYELLDEKYKMARFKNYQGYIEYINNNQRRLESLDPNSIKPIEEFTTEEEYAIYLTNLEQKGMEKYYIYNEGNKTYCVCLDSYGSYYIFEITSAMNYKLYLDTYTVPVDYFINQYEEATQDEKVELNIEQIFEAINDKDYKYIYSKISSSAKEKVFDSYDVFETYIRK